MNRKVNANGVWSLVLGLLVSALAGGCASSQPKGGYDARLMQMPPPGRARVIFVYNRRAPAAPFSIHDGTRFVGMASSKRCLVYDCDPGSHYFSTSFENVSLLDAQLLADRIYYVEVRSQHGWVMPSVGLYALRPNHSGWSNLPKWLAAARDVNAGETAPDAGAPKNTAHDERIVKHREKYLKDSDREQILPEYGQAQPVGSP